jgi:hypothetical protein
MGDRLHLLAGSAIFLDDLLCEETDEMRADYVREWTQPAIECALLRWKSCLEKPPVPSRTWLEFGVARSPVT